MKKLIPVVLGLVVCVTIMFSGCIFQAKSPVLTSLEITPTNVQVLVNETQEFIVTAYDQKGNLIEEFAEPVWTLDEGLGKLNQYKGTKVIFTAGDQVTEGRLTVAVDDLIATANIKVVEEIVDPLIWFESFEDEQQGQFPAKWTIFNDTFHQEAGTGPRVAADLPTTIPDGEQVMLYTTKPNGKKAEMETTIPEIAHGRLEFSVYQLPDKGSNLGFKPYYNDELLINFWISGGGDLRVSEAIKLGTGQWFTFRFEWNIETKELKVYQKENDTWILRAETEITNAPNRLFFDGGSDKNRESSGAIDNIRLYNLDLLGEDDE